MITEIIGSATLHCGDCREIIPPIEFSAVITDPVWPNCPPGLLEGSHRPYELLAETLALCRAETVVIILGFNSDPRFLNAVPVRWPYVRSQTLPYAFPAYSGRLLRGDEIAYVFGAIPKGRGLIPGRAKTICTSKGSRATEHPSPRADEHIEQLTGWWTPTGGSVLDPFMGTGSAGVAATHAGRSFTGIEIDPTYFDIACNRISQAQKQGRLFA